MSLLMKALANAENNKWALQQQAKVTDAQNAAANVFTAAQPSESSFSKVILGLIVLLILGILWFSYQIVQLNAASSAVVMANDEQQRPVLSQPRAAVNKAQEGFTSTTATAGAPHEKALLASEEVVKTISPVKKVTAVKNATKTLKKQLQPNAKSIEPTAQLNIETIQSNHNIAKLDKALAIENDNNLPPLTQAAKAIEPPVLDNSMDSITDTALPVNESIIEITHKPAKSNLDHHLQQAYQAFLANNYMLAKKHYRTVLQQNVGQTDALLGMAAIAQEQGRFPDAAGWYKKVLALEPHHPVALSGLTTTQPQNSFAAQETRLKQLIKKQPRYAQHYASLGNLYAAQQMWKPAQAAYFEANRFANDNALFAFNLAVSLEHLGKPSLAVPHYQRALEQVKTQQLSTPDAQKIQQRLQALQ